MCTGSSPGAGCALCCWWSVVVVSWCVRYECAGALWLVGDRWLPGGKNIMLAGSSCCSSVTVCSWGMRRQNSLAGGKADVIRQAAYTCATEMPRGCTMHEVGRLHCVAARIDTSWPPARRSTQPKHLNTHAVACRHARPSRYTHMTMLCTSAWAERAAKQHCRTLSVGT